MNKIRNRIVSLLLTFAMVLTLIPAATLTAHAADPNPITELWVGSTQVVQSGGTVTADISGPGWSYDSTTATLTLNEANITTTTKPDITNDPNSGYWSYGIYCRGDLNIIVEGNSTVDASAAADRSVGIWLSGNLSVSGSAELIAKGNSRGISIQGNLIISESVTVNGTAGGSTYSTLTGVFVGGGGGITVSDTANLTGHSLSQLYNYGIWCLSGNITIGSGATLTGIADSYTGEGDGKNYGVAAENTNSTADSFGQVSIEGTLVARAGNGVNRGNVSGLFLYKTNLVVSNGGSVRAECGDPGFSGATAYGVNASVNAQITVDAGGFLASGGTCAVNPVTTNVTIDGTPVYYEVSANRDGSNPTVCTNTAEWNSTYNGNFGAYKYINATTLYEVYINGTQVTRVNRHDVLGDGTVSYLPATDGSPARLTLNGASLTSVQLDGDAELSLTGTNTVGTVTNAGVVTVSGDGRLTLTGSLDCGNDSLTVASGTALTIQGTVTTDVVVNHGILINSSTTPMVLSEFTNNGSFTNSGTGNLTVTDTLTGSGSMVNEGTLVLPSSVGEQSAESITGDGLTEVKGVAAAPSVYYTNGTKLKSITHALDFTQAAATGGWNQSSALEDDGYIWDAEAKKLTLKNILVQSTDSSGIILPDNTILILEGISIIVSDDDVAIEGGGTLTLQGSGSLRANGPDGGLFSEKIAITDKVRVVVNGITTDMDVEGSEISVLGNAVLTSTKEILTENYTQAGSTSVKITGSNMTSGIMARGEMRINGGLLDISSNNAALMAIGAIKLGSGMGVLTPQGGKIASASTTVSGVNYSIASVLSADQTSLSIEVDEAQKLISTNGAKHVIIGSAPTTSGGGGGGGGGAGSGAATVSITDVQLKKMIDGSVDIPNIKIDASRLGSNSVVIPAKIVSAVNGSSDNKGLEVIMPSGTVTLDKTALAAVSGKGDMKLSIEPVAYEKLTDAQKTVLGTQADSAVVVDVNIYVNGIKTGTFGGGTLSISVPYTLKPGESKGSITVWFIKDNGAIEPKNGTYNAATGCVEFTTDHLSQYLIVKFPFADVTENAWYYDSVAYAYNNNLFSGTSETSFAPGAAMTRQMIWTVLARMDGKLPANMAEAKAWAMENKISDGSNPKNAITRGQMAAILYRYAQYKGYDTTQGGMSIREFEDYDSIPAYALEALGWTVNTGLLQGSGGKLIPQGDATRSQVAASLQRFIQNVAK